MYVLASRTGIVFEMYLIAAAALLGAFIVPD